MSEQRIDPTMTLSGTSGWCYQMNVALVIVPEFSERSVSRAIKPFHTTKSRSELWGKRPIEELLVYIRRIQARNSVKRSWTVPLPAEAI